MLGARAIGTRWLGSGRTQRRDYQSLSATLDSISAAVSLGILRSSTPVSASLATGAQFSGSVKRLRGVSGSIQASADHGGTIARIRPLAGTLEAVASFTGQPGRKRPLAGTLAWVESDLSGRAGRKRTLQATVSVSGELSGGYTRLRAVTGSVSTSGGLGGEIDSGIALSATVSWSAELSGRVSDFFAPSPPFRWIYVDPKIRDLYVTPKDRVIVVLSDDRGLSMDERIKQPSEVVDYTLDMRDWFKDIPEDYITDVTVTIDITGDPDDLESGPNTLAAWEPVGDPAHQAKLWFGGGRDGIEYKVTALVTTNAGRVEEKDFLIIIEEQ